MYGLLDTYTQWTRTGYSTPVRVARQLSRNISLSVSIYRRTVERGYTQGDRALARILIEITSSVRTLHSWVGNRNNDVWLDLCHNRCIRDLQFDILLQLKAGTFQPTQVQSSIRSRLPSRTILYSSFVTEPTPPYRPSTQSRLGPTAATPPSEIDDDEGKEEGEVA
ncbi:hypothetical protein JG688_00014847 [Phytophthora aleatoria]|uniref:Uncharacterized protein n=1 Tax=Phytophthora aleatoria TaxID=2496075 RepID=A0A8J5IGM0_9STRA|nr:hypothetical protein JG688_00014847 [Phytophthora aleatoria]